MRGGDIWQFVVIWYSVAFIVLCALIAINWR